MSKLRKWTSFVLCVLLVGALLVGCGDDTKQNDQPNKPGTTQGTEDPSGQQNTPADPAKKLELETPVGTLTFPEEWAGDVQTKDTSADGQYAVSFYGTVNGEDVLLFELSIGTKEGSYQLGSAPDVNGNMLPVWLNISEIEAKPEWSAEDTTRINTLQECVNDLIDQLNHMDGFQTAN